LALGLRQGPSGRAAPATDGKGLGRVVPGEAPPFLSTRHRDLPRRRRRADAINDKAQRTIKNLRPPCHPHAGQGRFNPIPAAPRAARGRSRPVLAVLAHPAPTRGLCVAAHGSDPPCAEVEPRRRPALRRPRQHRLRAFDTTGMTRAGSRSSPSSTTAGPIVTPRPKCAVGTTSRPASRMGRSGEPAGRRSSQQAAFRLFRPQASRAPRVRAGTPADRSAGWTCRRPPCVSEKPAGCVRRMRQRTRHVRSAPASVCAITNAAGAQAGHSRAIPSPWGLPSQEPKIDVTPPDRDAPGATPPKAMQPGVPCSPMIRWRRGIEPDR
jgi:hypothetical protein